MFGNAWSWCHDGTLDTFQSFKGMRGVFAHTFDHFYFWTKFYKTRPWGQICCKHLYLVISKLLDRIIHSKSRGGAQAWAGVHSGCFAPKLRIYSNTLNGVTRKSVFDFTIKDFVHIIHVCNMYWSTMLTDWKRTINDHPTTSSRIYGLPTRQQCVQCSLSLKGSQSQVLPPAALLQQVESIIRNIRGWVNSWGGR